MKVASFTVRASQEQAIRWNRAAAAEGFQATGQWIARAVDAYLRVRAKAGLPLPLAWRRFGRFPVRLENGEEVAIRGAISPPFGVYRGDAEGPKRTGRHHCLVYIPERRIVASLRSSRQAKALAAELAPVLIRGDPLTPPEGIIERHRREAV